jgi:hypothetical protein
MRAAPLEIGDGVESQKMKTREESTEVRDPPSSRAPASTSIITGSVAAMSSLAEISSDRRVSTGLPVALSYSTQADVSARITNRCVARHLRRIGDGIGATHSQGLLTGHRLTCELSKGEIDGLCLGLSPVTEDLRTLVRPDALGDEIRRWMALCGFRSHRVRHPEGKWEFKVRMIPKSLELSVGIWPSMFGIGWSSPETPGDNWQFTRP